MMKYNKSNKDFLKLIIDIQFRRSRLLQTKTRNDRFVLTIIIESESLIEKRFAFLKRLNNRDIIKHVLFEIIDKI